MQIELTELLLFGKQLGLALVGAASLWGLVFAIKCRHENEKQRCLIFEWITHRLFTPLCIGIIIALFSWLLLTTFIPVYAHEGITLISTAVEKSQALALVSPAFIGWILFLFFALLFKIAKPALFNRYIGIFFAIQLGIAALLMSVPVWVGEFSRAQLFFISHSLHSILTLGTVLILDFLFLISRHSVILKQHIFPLFPTLSKIIWIGLGIDFLSTTLIWSDAIILTPKFFFVQTVIGIIIINGVFLSGPIARKILNSIQEGGEVLTKRWTSIANTAGIISITSWFTITLVDFFENLTLKYYHFLLLYLALLIIGFLGHVIWHSFDREKPLLIKT